MKSPLRGNYSENNCANRGHCRSRRKELSGPIRRKNNFIPGKPEPYKTSSYEKKDHYFPLAGVKLYPLTNHYLPLCDSL